VRLAQAKVVQTTVAVQTLQSLVDQLVGHGTDGDADRPPTHHRVAEDLGRCRRPRALFLAAGN
jgi:hypothetical protein